MCKLKEQTHSLKGVSINNYHRRNVQSISNNVSFVVKYHPAYELCWRVSIKMLFMHKNLTIWLWVVSVSYFVMHVTCTYSLQGKGISFRN